MFGNAAVAVTCVTLIAACGSDPKQDVAAASPTPQPTTVPEPSLGSQPWTREEQQAFLRPAYEELSSELGELVTFVCTPPFWRQYLPEGVPESHAVVCTVVYANGAKGMRQVVFDDEGRVAAEIDLPITDQVRAGPSGACTHTPQTSDLPDCEDLPSYEAEVPPLPPADPSLYGRGGNGAPADSGPAEDSNDARDAQNDDAVGCDDVVVTPNSGNVMQEVQAAGISCSQAEQILLDWGQSEYPPPGPDGFDCETPKDIGNSVYQSMCEKPDGSARVSFVQGP